MTAPARAPIPGVAAPAPVLVEPPRGVPPAEPAEDGAVVLRAPNWIGDAVLALPAVSALAGRFRRHPVIVMARGSVAPLFVGLDGVSEVVRARGRGASRLATARRALSRSRIAVGVVFPHSMGSAAELAVGRVEQMWGYGGPLRRLALDVALPRRWIRGRHRWEEYALLAAAVSGEPVPERYPVVSAPGDAAAADGLWAGAGIASTDAVVGIFPGTNAPSRRWPPERFAAVASRLGHAGARVVLFGAEHEKPLTAAISAAADPAPLDWAGRTPLPILAECFRRLRFLVTNDTGPMHLAAAVGAPLLDLCGAADERVTGPRGPDSEVIVHPIHCRPCAKNRCAYNLECLRGITVERVVAHVRGRAGI